MQSPNTDTTPTQEQKPEVILEEFEKPPGSPIIHGKIDGVPAKKTVDSGAVSTVMKKGLLPGATPPASRLRLKGAAKGTKVLYGPRRVELDFGPVKVPWYVYECDIEDDLLLGSDFIHKYKVHIDSENEAITIKIKPDSPAISVPFKWEFSPSVSSFDSGKVFYQVRAGKGVKLQPFHSTVLNENLKTDCSIDTNGMTTEERQAAVRTINLISDCQSDEGLPSCSVRTTDVSVSVPQGEAANPSDGQKQPLELEEIRLGVITTPIEFVPTPSKLPDGVLVRSGIIPCVNAPVQMEIMNMSDSYVQIPAHTIIAEVYLINPVSYNNSCEEALYVKSRLTKLKKDDQLYNEFDAVIDPDPKLPPIPEEEPLPPDLQDLVNRCDGLNENQKARLVDLLRTHHDIFAKDNMSFGKCPWMKFTIDTGDHPPIKQRARPLPIHHRQAVKEQFIKYLECGAVVPSNSAWASPILCVLKKTGKVRVCIDYRRLNAITRIPATPIPRTQDLLEKLAGNEWYVHTDVAWGYHNVEIHPDDRCKTAVILPDDLGLPSRQFEFTRLSFGLSAAPGQFQAITDKLIRPALNPKPENDLGEAVGVYLDDVCIGGNDFETMLQRIEALFNRLRAAGLLLKAKKCFFFQKELNFLGHKISKEGISQDSEKVDRITHWPTPADVTELKGWLGLTTYYSKFLRNMAEEATPLYRLLQADVPFIWSSKCQRAFDIIKQMITSAPVLGVPDLSQGNFIVDCDASQNSIGAVLSQIQNGQERPLYFWSKTLNKAQKNYCTTHKELLAMVEAILRFHHYLAGAPFLVRTDHASLQWLKSFKNPTGKLSRWIEKLSSYQFEIQYRRGQEQGNADSLSILA